MQLVKKRQDIVDNCTVLEGYLTGKDAKEKAFAKEIVQSALFIVVYKVNGVNHFAPNEFVVYKNNSMKGHQTNKAPKEIKEVNNAIEKVVGRPFCNDTVESKFKEYLDSLGLDLPANDRLYWRIKNERGKNLNLDL